jgi:hypothetical protein
MKKQIKKLSFENLDSCGFVENRFNEEIEREHLYMVFLDSLKSRPMFTPRNINIVKDYFGIECEERNFKELSAKYDLCVQRIRDIIKFAVGIGSFEETREPILQGMDYNSYIKKSN